MTQSAPSEIVPIPQEGLARLIDIGGGLDLLAQRSEDLASCGDEVLDDARAAAAPLLDLIWVVPEVTQHLDRCSGPCDLVPSQRSDLRP
jgi:hypothetical protein